MNKAQLIYGVDMNGSHPEIQAIFPRDLPPSFNAMRNSINVSKSEWLFHL
jgi:hypothetical protein